MAYRSCQQALALFAYHWVRSEGGGALAAALRPSARTYGRGCSKDEASGGSRERRCGQVPPGGPHPALLPRRGHPGQGRLLRRCAVPGARLRPRDVRPARLRLPPVGAWPLRDRRPTRPAPARRGRSGRHRLLEPGLRGGGLRRGCGRLPAQAPLLRPRQDGARPPGRLGRPACETHRQPAGQRALRPGGLRPRALERPLRGLQGDGWRLREAPQGVVLRGQGGSRPLVPVLPVHEGRAREPRLRVRPRRVGLRPLRR